MKNQRKACGKYKCRSLMKLWSLERRRTTYPPLACYGSSIDFQVSMRQLLLYEVYLNLRVPLSREFSWWNTHNSHSKYFTHQVILLKIHNSLINDTFVSFITMSMILSKIFYFFLSLSLSFFCIITLLCICNMVKNIFFYYTNDVFLR